MLKKLHLLLLVLFLVTAYAQAKIELNPSHPDTYRVVKGDTLWDISARFLKSPWVWPEVWQANPQIKNPHLIYPDDLISLIYIDGKPTLQLSRGHRTVKLSPKGRRISHDEAIPTVPLSAIKPFLKKLRILKEAEVKNAPYVVAIDESHLIASETNLIYIRGLVANQGEAFAIARPTLVYTDIPKDYPWSSSEYKDRKTVAKEWTNTSDNTGKAIVSRFWKKNIFKIYWDNVDTLGYEVAEVGTAVVTATNQKEITTMKVNGNIQEIREGDIIIPLNKSRFNAFFQPKPATIDDDNIRIVALNNAPFIGGKWQVVAISRGFVDGVHVGDVFDVNRPERQYRDKIKHPNHDLKAFYKPSSAYVTLPEEYLANIMVFQTYDHISYALIVDGNRAVKVYDHVRAP